MIYLASPYSHKSPLIRELRYRAVEENVARLMREGTHTFSPIIHCHNMAVRYNMPGDIAFWREYNKNVIQSLPGFGVLKLPGWDKSEGIKFECRFADTLGRPRNYFEPEGEYVEALRKLA